MVALRAWDGKEITHVKALLRLVATTRVDRAANVTVSRDGKRRRSG
jgi:hypothetical protein